MCRIRPTSMWVFMYEPPNAFYSLQALTIQNAVPQASWTEKNQNVIICACVEWIEPFCKRIAYIPTVRVHWIIWYLVSYDISLWLSFGWHFLWIHKYTNIVMNDGWVHPLAKTTTFSCQQLVMKYCHGWLTFGWEITW